MTKSISIKQLFNLSNIFLRIELKPVCQNYYLETNAFEVKFGKPYNTKCYFPFGKKQLKFKPGTFLNLREDFFFFFPIMVVGQNPIKTYIEISQANREGSRSTDQETQRLSVPHYILSNPTSFAIPCLFSFQESIDFPLFFFIFLRGVQASCFIFIAESLKHRRYI